MVKVNLGYIILLALVFLLSCVVVFLIVKKRAGVRSILKAQQEAKEIIEKAKEDGEKLKRESTLEAKEKYLNLKSDFERQTRDRRRKLNDMERRLVKKEENLEHKFQTLEKKERDFSQKEQQLYSREKEIGNKVREHEEIGKKALAELERIAGMSQEEAKREIQRKVEDEAKLEAVQTYPPY